MSSQGALWGFSILNNNPIDLTSLYYVDYIKSAADKIGDGWVQWCNPLCYKLSISKDPMDNWEYMYLRVEVQGLYEKGQSDML